jgi:hypothetical protein
MAELAGSSGRVLTDSTVVISIHFSAYPHYALANEPSSLGQPGPAWPSMAKHGPACLATALTIKPVRQHTCWVERVDGTATCCQCSVVTL